MYQRNQTIGNHKYIDKKLITLINKIKKMKKYKTFKEASRVIAVNYNLPKSKRK